MLVILPVFLDYRVPHYHVVARPIVVFGAPLVNWFRCMLIEGVYRRIGK
jgi:hypothetical protein